MHWRDGLHKGDGSLQVGHLVGCQALDDHDGDHDENQTHQGHADHDEPLLGTPAQTRKPGHQVAEGSPQFGGETTRRPTPDGTRPGGFGFG